MVLQQYHLSAFLFNLFNVARCRGHPVGVIEITWRAYENNNYHSAEEILRLWHKNPNVNTGFTVLHNPMQVLYVQDLLYVTMLQ